MTSWGCCSSHTHSSRPLSSGRVGRRWHRHELHGSIRRGPPVSANIIDGAQAAADIRAQVKVRRLGMKNRTPTFTPCTPAGVIELLKRSGTVMEGAQAVVLGRSNIVGLPVSLLLLGANATVSICHSRTQNLAALTRQADIL